MAATIITKNGSGEPLGGVLVRGELAVDVDGGALYTSSDGTDIVPLGGDLGGEPAGSFLRSNVSDNYESGVLTFELGTEIALASNALFRATGSALNIDLKGTTDFTITNDFTARYNFSDDGNLTLSTGWIRVEAGSALLPSHSFENDSDTGIYRAGVNIIGFATAGTQKATINQAGDFTVTQGNIKAGDGSETAPAWSFNSDSNTGIYRSGTDALSIATGGTQKVLINSAGFRLQSGDITIVNGDLVGNANVFIDGVLAGEFGSAAAPTHSFQSDTNTGMYRVSTDTLGFSTNGTLRTQIGSTGEITGGLFSGTGVTTASSKFEVVATHPGGAADANTIYFVTG